ncbi:hypothetical protein CDL15_Pgr016000 [Punica granatum]|uniref:Uncharacterized protein n=1 Tax=Punica granatum TaxID=22663 RepID=A0A218XPV9_PUNGR|nr:hypothetical protein CDL15_Pgr016000 [Punica granatum]
MAMPLGDGNFAPPRKYLNCPDLFGEDNTRPEVDRKSSIRARGRAGKMMESKNFLKWVFFFSPISASAAPSTDESSTPAAAAMPSPDDKSTPAPPDSHNAPPVPHPPSGIGLALHRDRPA